MALSKSNLSGCFEFTLASGFALRSWSFLCLGFFGLSDAWAKTAVRTSTVNADIAIFREKRLIPPQFERAARGSGRSPLPTHRARKRTRLPPYGPLPAVRAHLAPARRR